MAFYRAKRASGGGGQMVETVLWTNPNIATTASAVDFNAQTVNLSDDINNYDYIAIEFMQQNVLSQINNVNKVYYRVSDYKNFRGNSGARSPIGSLGFVFASNYATCHRPFWYVSDTEARFKADTSGNNSLDVPKYIYGCKVS